MNKRLGFSYKQRDYLRRKMIYELLSAAPGAPTNEINSNLSKQQFAPLNELDMALWRGYFYPIVSGDASLYYPIVVRGESLSYLGRALLARSRRDCIS